MTNKIDSNMMVVFWESASISRQNATAAFSKVGAEKYLPKVDYASAIKHAALEVAHSYCDDDEAEDGRYKVFSLPNGRGKVGCEVRRFIKGENRNKLPFLFSLGALQMPDGTHRVHVLESANENIDKFKQKVEARANQAWDRQCCQIGANDITAAIIKLVRASHGILLRDRGGIWYLPVDASSDYLTVSNAINQYGVALHHLTFDPKVNRDLVQHVTQTLIDRAEDAFTGIISHCDDLEERGGKSRANGRQTRLDEWLAWKETMEHNKTLLGKAFVQVSKSCQAAYERIGMEAVDCLA